MIAVRNTKTLYLDGDRCMKVFVEDYPKADVFNEACNHARIEGTGLFVPKVLEVTQIDGRWSIVFEYIKGKTLYQKMQSEPEKRGQYLDLLVTLQMEVLTRPCPLLNNLKDKMNRLIIASDLDFTTRYDLHNRLNSLPTHKKICHGDFNPSNIIISEAGVPYITDWAHVTQGNASADAARTYLWFHLSGDEQAAKEYLALFFQKSETEKSYVKKWLPLVAVAQSVTGNRDEQAKLLQWAMDAKFFEGDFA